MGAISADTLRRIYLLYLVGLFANGPYGLLRLHKVSYASQRESENRPFQYIRWLHGQYSPQLEDVKDQLESMGYLRADPLDTAITINFEPPNGGPGFVVNLGGNRYLLKDRSLLPLYARALAAFSPDWPSRIQVAVTTYGYLKEADLLARCYAFPEFEGTSEGDIIHESTLPERIEVDLSDDECDDLEISLNPKFINAMGTLAEAVTEREIPWDRIRTIERLPTLGA